MSLCDRLRALEAWLRGTRPRWIELPPLRLHVMGQPARISRADERAWARFYNAGFRLRPIVLELPALPANDEVPHG